MTRFCLIVSERLEFRSLVRSVLSEKSSDLDFRFAADRAGALSKIQEECFPVVIVDDDTVKGFFDDQADPSVDMRTPQIFRIRSGGRFSSRVRNTPFPYSEMIVPDTMEAAGIRSAVSEIVLEVTKSSVNSKVSAVPPKVPPQAPQPEPLKATKPMVQARPSSAAPVGTSVATRTNPEIILPDIIVIGSSTGGPEALERFFKAMDSWFSVPVVIVQHMPPGFTRGLAERITKVTDFVCHEAHHEQVLVPGEIYIAPGDFHLRLRKGGDKVLCALDKGPLLNSVRPAVDPLFETAAGIYGSKVMSIVFTGMGEDGAAGAAVVKEKGGCVAIQDEESCVVWGMPGAVARLALHDMQGPPDKIAAVVSRQMMRRGAPPKKMGKVG